MLAETEGTQHLDFQDHSKGVVSYIFVSLHMLIQASLKDIQHSRSVVLTVGPFGGFKGSPLLNP